VCSVRRDKRTSAHYSNEIDAKRRPMVDAGARSYRSRERCCSRSPQYERGLPALLKNAIEWLVG